MLPGFRPKMVKESKGVPPRLYSLSPSFSPEPFFLFFPPPSPSSTRAGGVVTYNGMKAKSSSPLPLFPPQRLPFPLLFFPSLPPWKGQPDAAKNASKNPADCQIDARPSSFSPEIFLSLSSSFFLFFLQYRRVVW